VNVENAKMESDVICNFFQLEFGQSGVNSQDVQKHVALAARQDLAYAMEASVLVKQLKHNFAILKHVKLVRHFVADINLIQTFF
jgi:hypothetical protein